MKVRIPDKDTKGIDMTRTDYIELRDYIAIHASDRDIMEFIEDVTYEVNEGVRDSKELVDESTNPEIRCIARYRYADAMIEQRTK